MASYALTEKAILLKPEAEQRSQVVVLGRPRGVIGGADVGRQEILDAGADGTHRQVAGGVLFDLDHAAEFGEQLDGAAEIVEVVHRPWRVFGHELNVVPGPGLTDQLGDRRPGAEEMCSHAGLSGL